MDETCFTLDDDDCSGTNNDPNAIGCSDFYLDNDADGYGLASDTQCLCVAEVPYSSVTSGDCDDTRDTVSPGRIETCDLSNAGLPQDEDCDGDVDEPNADNCTVYHYDYDGDDFGIGSDSICMCDPDGYYRAFIGGDCVDTDATINPDESNCGLMGEIPKENAMIVISGVQYTDYRTESMVGNFDYNNDGIMDIAVVDPEFDTQYTNAGALFIFLGPLDSSVDISSGTDADLMFSPERASEFLGRYSGISVGNMDADAADEIIVSGLSNSYLIDDNLHGQVSITDSNLGVNTLVGINVHYGTKYPEGTKILGDVNLDGHSDIMRSNQYNQYIYLGDGTGGFTATTQAFRQYVSYPSVVSRNVVLDVDDDARSRETSGKQ
jgi:hypothetical protein